MIHFQSITIHQLYQQAIELSVSPSKSKILNIPIHLSSSVSHRSISIQLHQIFHYFSKLIVQHYRIWMYCLQSEDGHSKLMYTYLLTLVCSILLFSTQIILKLIFQKLIQYKSILILQCIIAITVLQEVILSEMQEIYFLVNALLALIIMWEQLALTSYKN